MRTTLNLDPEAEVLVKDRARQRSCSLGRAASELILEAVKRPKAASMRNGVPLVGNGVPMTREEVNRMLDEE
jgi:hypothetical protein